MRLQRVFVADGVTYQDPGQSIGSIDTIKKILSSFCADIINRTHSVKIEGDKEIYTFEKSRVGVHG